MEKSIIGSSHRLGILGGGQLGRMFIQEAINYDIHVHIMDDSPSSPCFSVATSFTIGDITDYADVMAFGKDLDVLTVEIENVNIHALYDLQKAGVHVFPQPNALEIIKDKGLQKQFYAEHNLPTAPFEVYQEQPNLAELETKLPFVQKLRTGGYDGKGVQVIKTKSDLANAFDAPSIIEELIPFKKELSVIVARNKNGEVAVYPTVECEFNDANLVSFLFSPADISENIEKNAKSLAVEVVNKLNMVGILAVEFFLTEDDQLLINEIAPRPHNSGHHTIECNDTSQFEQHLRAILNLPLGSTKMTRFGAMLNLIGPENMEGKAVYHGLTEVLQSSGTHVHLYGKEMTKPHRKMGHVTLTSDSIDGAKQLANSIKDVIHITV